MMRSIRILGMRFNLRPRLIHDQPIKTVEKLAYVEFPLSETLKLARWHNGEWRDDKLRPFEGKPVAWYSIEVPHG